MEPRFITTEENKTVEEIIEENKQYAGKPNPLFGYVILSWVMRENANEKGMIEIYDASDGNPFIPNPIYAEMMKDTGEVWKPTPKIIVPYTDALRFSKMKRPLDEIDILSMSMSFKEMFKNIELWDDEEDD